jgi:hypothetical protein
MTSAATTDHCRPKQLSQSLGLMDQGKAHSLQQSVVRMKPVHPTPHLSSSSTTPTTSL